MSKARRVRPEDEGKHSTKGEWKTHTLKEFKTSNSVIWRAQLSTAPDGTKFAGVRKVAIMKDGAEVMTRDGITLKYDADTINDEVDKLVELLQLLKGGKVRVKDDSRYALMNRESGGRYALMNRETRDWLTGVANRLGVTKGRTTVLFSTAEEAREYRAVLKNSALWVVKRV